MSDRIAIALTVNGMPRTTSVEPRRLLADVLREEFGLTGAHLSCEIGVCGACTVLVDGEPTRSCLMLAAQADGASIETVESLARDGLSPLQQAFWDCHALQCGFCTPGFLMTLTGLLRRRPDADDGEIDAALDDVLCRCTGYQNIRKAARAARDRINAAPNKG